MHRHKKTACTPITIQELHDYKYEEFFERYVIVTYRYFLDKSQKRNYIFLLDLIDDTGHMTITLNVINICINEPETMAMEIVNLY